jgi:hypothetical protein
MESYKDMVQMTKYDQICFAADPELSAKIEQKRGDIPRSLFVRKTLRVSLGLEKIGVVLPK